MTMKLILSLALFGYFLTCTANPIYLNGTAIGISAGLTAGAPLNATDTIFQAIFAANATTNVTAAGIAAANAAGLPIEPTAAIAECIFNAAAANTSDADIVDIIEAVANVNITTEGLAYAKQIAITPAPSPDFPICPPQICGPQPPKKFCDCCFEFCELCKYVIVFCDDYLPLVTFSKKNSSLLTPLEDPCTRANIWP